MTREKHNEYRRDHYKTLKLLHRCVRCGSPSNPGNVLCPDCLKKQREQNAKRQNRAIELRAQGLCTCGQELHPRRNKCYTCMLKRREYSQNYRARITDRKHTKVDPEKVQFIDV